MAHNESQALLTTECLVLFEASETSMMPTPAQGRWYNALTHQMRSTAHSDNSGPKEKRLFAKTVFLLIQVQHVGPLGECITGSMSMALEHW